jgi:hypothetical protein
MPDNTSGRTKKARDAYFDKQWAEAEEERKKRQEARRRAWWRWQQEAGRKAPYSSWLVIPCNLSDYGARPLPSGTPYWSSPFIGVISPDPSGKPLAGAPNLMVARVFNLGAATAAPTRIDFYWADPSIGLGAADAHHIGVESVEVQPMSSRLVTCTTPWIPAYVNGGHECAFVICHNHVFDPVQQPFKPWADRHVGQKNLTVLPAVQQMFMLWAPSTLAGAGATLRVLALRGVAPRGFEILPTAYETLAHAAQQVLHGLRVAPAATATHVKRPVVFAERIDPQRALKDVRVLEDTRQVRMGDAPAWYGPEPDPAVEQWGDVAVRLDRPAGTAVRIALDLRGLDVPLNEIVILNLVNVAGGGAAGGYTLALANPGWFTSSPTARRQGDVMAQPTEKSLEALVIEHNAQARLTHQVAEQLARYLPIKSLDDLKRGLREVVVGSQKLPFSAFEPFLTKELFPIENLESLVRKVSAATRTALAMAAQPAGRAAIHPAVRAVLAATAAGEAGRIASIPAGHFTGPSIFGSTSAKRG